MGLYRIRLTPLDIDAPAVGFPARDAGCKLLVGVGDAFVIFLAVFVLLGVGIRIAAAPKILDKILALFVRLKGHERALFVLRDDIGDVIVQPALVGLLDLNLYIDGLVPGINGDLL